MTKMFESKKEHVFRNTFSEGIFNQKYSHQGCESWEKLSDILIEDVCNTKETENSVSLDELNCLKKLHGSMRFIAGGRYLYYAGRPHKYFNNCYLLKSEEDSRQDWANLSWKAENCLMTGGGIGNDYSIYRASGTIISRTGGYASGPLPKMEMINEIGRRVMQGGSRRSAIYASLNYAHEDILDFLKIKNWKDSKIPGTGMTVQQIKEVDFNFPAPLDMTNISVNYDTSWLMNYWNTGDYGEVFFENVKQALMTAEPGFSFNFFDKEKETLRNAPVHPDTYVYTSSGYQKVRDIVNKPIHVWTGYQYAPTTFSLTRKNDNIIKVQMTGRRSILCSKDHEFIINNESRIKAEDLKTGDTIKVSEPVSLGGKRVKESYALAFIYGDGTFSVRYPRAEAPLCGVKEKILERLVQSDIEHTTSFDKRGILRVYFKNHDIFRSREKSSFPDEVFSWDLESRLNFLAGLADADGSYSGNGLRIGSKHFEFLQGVQRLCDSVGIVGMINKGSKGGYSGSSESSWVIVIKGKLSILPTVRFDLEDGETPEIKVVSVVDAGVSDVYCCDVGVEEHSFMAEGVIISNCTEVTSEDDSDVCNLASINMSRIETIEEFKNVIELATKFLVCGTLRAQLPYEKVYKTREKNRRLGLGIMGVHEWLIKRGYRYEVTEELHKWLTIYKTLTPYYANKFCDKLGISRPIATRAIAPTGSIGILAGTTTGIEPLFAVAYKRRFLKGNDWHYQHVIDGTAKELITLYGADPGKIESSVDLAKDFERRIKFQADVQDYVDMSISSTINLPSWGSELNNESTVPMFAETLAKYAHRLRGFTCYPDGARGGQPLTSVPYEEALTDLGKEYKEEIHDICDISGKGGTCGS